VSVVIAVRNGERFVAQAIESVLLQTYHRVETIVVENASTDGTVEILAGFRDRIRVIHRRQPGLSAARNAGIEASSGELVAFLDADDLWMPGKLDRQVEVFMGDPSCAFVFGEVFAIDARNAIVGHWRKRDLGRPVADRSPTASWTSTKETTSTCRPWSCAGSACGKSGDFGRTWTRRRTTTCG